VRCAIYTRKSSAEGLDREFTSLDNQRLYCAAWIASQASEGFLELPERYDDGGVSGGTLDRPALLSLRQAIAAGLVDIVVVHKIDRLSRSLRDFANLVAEFERVGVTFVSVTQAFNTATARRHHDKRALHAIVLPVVGITKSTTRTRSSWLENGTRTSCYHFATELGSASRYLTNGNGGTVGGSVLAFCGRASINAFWRSFRRFCLGCALFTGGANIRSRSSGRKNMALPICRNAPSSLAFCRSDLSETFTPRLRKVSIALDGEITLARTLSASSISSFTCCAPLVELTQFTRPLRRQ
jgi:hypothetical protein